MPGAAIYVLLASSTTILGGLWGVWIFGLTFLASFGGATMASLLVVAVAGQGLFVFFRFLDDEVVLISPVRRIVVRRTDVASVELWERTPTEDLKPFLRQGSNLSILLLSGRRIRMSLIDVRILRRIKESLMS